MVRVIFSYVPNGWKRTALDQNKQVTGNKGYFYFILLIHMDINTPDNTVQSTSTGVVIFASVLTYILLTD